MHEALDIHGWHELPSVAHDAVSLHQIQRLSIVASEHVYVLAVGGGHCTERAPRCVHTLHVDPLLL